MFLEEKKQGEPAKVLDETSKLLLKAATVVEQRGLCQGDFSDAEGRVCLAGAIRVADHGTPHLEGMTEVGFLAGRRVADIFGGQYAPPRWNDEPGRTADQVAAKLRAMALGL